MKIHLFIPCLVDQFYPGVAVSMCRVLKKLGVEYVYMRDQTCCGQPAFNSGYHAEATELAERFLRVFEPADTLVAPSGSCVSMVKIYYPQLELSRAGRRTLERLGPRIFEFSDFLVRELKVVDVGAQFRGKVTYHDSCHLLRELKIQEPPRQLIRNVRGLEFVELDDLQTCCGFGGTFAVKFPEISTAMGADKAAAIERSGADVVVANDSSCLMQIAGVLSRRKSRVVPMHLAELLAQGI
ncbi:MAG: (Fe-S)-binding protein [Acidobacteriia bacterium]|nr:(Fe-S)-binding protein [Terriglobia bacterium]